MLAFLLVTVLPLLMCFHLGLIDILFIFSIMFILISSGFNFFFFVSEFFLFDKLSFIIIMLSMWLFSVVLLIAQKYSGPEGGIMKYKAWSFILMMFLIFTIMMNELLGFYIFFEVSLVPLVFIILGWGYQVERIQASFYLFFYTMVGSLPMLMMFLLVFSNYSLDWFGLSFLSGSLIVKNVLVYVILSVAFFIKLPLYGVHLWLPKAHVEAPVAGSMVLAAVLLKLSLYGFYRAYPAMSMSKHIVSILLVALLWGSLLSSLVCLRQTDMKALIAYSSVGHMGVMMAGFYLYSQLSMKGAFIIMLVHGFCSSALFYLVNFHYERSSSRQVFNNRGQLILFNYVGVMWFLLLVVNFSAPPFISLVGEIEVYVGTLLVDYWLMTVLGITSFIVASFCIYLYSVLLHGVVTKYSGLQLESDVSFLVLLFHFLPCFFLIFFLDFTWF